MYCDGCPLKCTVLVIQITYNMNIKFYQHRRLLDKDIRDMVGVVVTSKVIRLLMKSARGNKGTNKVRIMFHNHTPATLATIREPKKV